MKEFIGYLAVVLTFLGYIPYIADTLKGKTKPHIYTWFVWGLVTSVAFGLQITHNAGAGSFVTLAAATICFVIFLCGLKQGDKDITLSDTVFLVLALFALVLWIFAKQPVISVILLSIIDMLGFIPTIRKSWRRPYEETLISYSTNVVRFGLAIYALKEYTIITSLYPVTWIFANGAFSVFLWQRRKTIKKN